jgi:hypothetical protein
MPYLFFMGELNTGNSNSMQNGVETVPAGADFQLSKLSSVLNGLTRGAAAINSHLDEAWKAVQSGTYRVDPLRLSQRIVRDSLLHN